MGTSPAQRMLNRRTKSILPTTEKQLAPRGSELLKADQARIKQEQQRQLNNYNKSAKDLEILEEGDTIRLKPFRIGKKEWEKGVVLKWLDEISYEIETRSGTFRRDRIDLRKTPEIPHEPLQTPNEIEEDDNTPPSAPSAPSAPSTPSTPSAPSPVRQSSDAVSELQPGWQGPGQLRRSAWTIVRPSYLEDYIA